MTGEDRGEADVAPGVVSSDQATAVTPARPRPPSSLGLPRERLTGRLGSVWEGRLAVVTGPAGSGKTTLLAQFAASADGPSAWCHAEAADGDAVRLLAHLHHGLSRSAAHLATHLDPWDSVDAAILALDRMAPVPVLLVIDEMQALEGTPSAVVIERLAWLAPPNLAILVASRRQPAFDLSRLRVADRLIEIGADDLRFRSWEVERLFHDVYREPLPPADLATLARRTQGWAAGLQLFHLASQGKPVSERRQMVRNLSSRSRLVREYLTHNVIDELPGSLREFLLDTCALGRLTGALCDRFLGRSGSAEALEALERRQIFLCPIEDGAAFRYHEVLRSYLEACLVEQIGERQARDRYARAGALLETSGASSDALQAYCRAGDESAALRLLSRSGAEMADDPGTWLDLVPSGLADHDPWLMLARARHDLAAGHWRQALASYERAESSFNGSGDRYRRERLAVAMWLDPAPPPGADWVGVIRQATRMDPLAAGHLAATLPGPYGRFAAGMAALLAGQFHDAGRLLQQTAEDADATPAISAGARLAAGIAGLLVGAERGQKDVHEGREQAEDLGLTWPARLASCAELCLSAGPPPDLSAICLDAEDTWGGALIRLLQGLSRQQDSEAALAALVESAGLFRTVGAGVLEAWARAAAATAAVRARHPDLLQLLATAEAAARATSAWGALAATYRAAAEAEPARAQEHLALADRLAVDEIRQLSAASTGDATRRAVVVSCFGEFCFRCAGGEMDLGGAKPRVRSLVRLLAVHSGRAVHRETLIEALWPEANTRTGTRNLHVAISAARQLVERAPVGALILREGDAYRLVLPEGAEIDVRSFDDELARSRRARAQGDVAAMRDALSRCLELYRGDVLAAEGGAEWVLEIRERYRVQAAGAAEALAEAHLAAGEYAEAARVCEHGLAIDRYRDRLWRHRGQALEGAGDRAAAARAREDYDDVLRELGVAT